MTSNAHSEIVLLSAIQKLKVGTVNESDVDKVDKIPPMAIFSEDSPPELRKSHESDYGLITKEDTELISWDTVCLYAHMKQVFMCPPHGKGRNFPAVELLRQRQCMLRGMMPEELGVEESNGSTNANVGSNKRKRFSRKRPCGNAACCNPNHRYEYLNRKNDTDREAFLSKLEEFGKFCKENGIPDQPVPTSNDGDGDNPIEKRYHREVLLGSIQSDKSKGLPLATYFLSEEEVEPGQFRVWDATRNDDDQLQLVARLNNVTYLPSSEYHEGEHRGSRRVDFRQTIHNNGGASKIISSIYEL